MTKVQSDAIEDLREVIKPGSRVYTILRHVSNSGMMRVIDVYVFESAGADVVKRRISWTAAIAIEATYNRKHEGVKMAGCGMDMGYQIVYELGYRLYNDGYALKHEWL